MAPVKINPDNIRAFKDAGSFHKWLGKHHDKEEEIWIKIHKLDSGIKSINPKEAIDVVLCWGWIDGLRKGFDDNSYLQRYTPRKTKSIWSQINVDNVARLIRALEKSRGGPSLLAPRKTRSMQPSGSTRSLSEGACGCTAPGWLIQ